MRAVPPGTHALPAPQATPRGFLLSCPVLYAQELTPGVRGGGAGVSHALPRGPRWRWRPGPPTGLLSCSRLQIHLRVPQGLPATQNTHGTASRLLPLDNNVSSVPTTSERPAPSTGGPRLLHAPDCNVWSCPGTGVKPSRPADGTPCSVSNTLAF